MSCTYKEIECDCNDPSSCGLLCVYPWLNGLVFCIHYPTSQIDFSLLRLPSSRPAIAGKSIGDLERDLFSLPARMGGLGLYDPSSVADFEFEPFETSVSIALPLIQEIIQQCTKFSAAILGDHRQAKVDVLSSRHQQQASRLSELMSLLPDNLRHILQLSSEKGGYQFFPLGNMVSYFIRIL